MHFKWYLSFIYEAYLLALKKLKTIFLKHHRSFITPNLNTFIYNTSLEVAWFTIIIYLALVFLGSLPKAHGILHDKLICSFKAPLTISSAKGLNLLSYSFSKHSCDHMCPHACLTSDSLSHQGTFWLNIIL